MRPLLLAALAVVGTCGLIAGRAAVPVSAPAPADAAIADLGKKLFFDPSLSASGRQSCSSCHSPSYAYGPPNGLAVQLGGSDLRHAGLRAVPSLSYTLNRTPIWSHEQPVSLAERLEEAEHAPTGGFTWDGRFDRLSDQATFPLLNTNEMANGSPSAVVAKIERAPYAAAFRAVFGANVFGDTKDAFASAMHAIERFELTDPSFHPYTSKFDAYLDGMAKLDPAEMRGKKLFDDPKRGGCAACHVDVRGADGSHPLFTDFQFEALGVPRNMDIPANRDAHYYDMGLCGPLRSDKASTSTYCGLFKTPTLRNVATRRVFFHNGRFHTLRDALTFYVERDTAPQKWYARGPGGRLEKFDDLPQRYRVNVDTIDQPLTEKLGGRPVWSKRDIDDVIAFLRTLTDGYRTSGDRVTARR